MTLLKHVSRAALGFLLIFGAMLLFVSVVHESWVTGVFTWIGRHMLFFTAAWFVLLIVLLTPLFRGILEGMRMGESKS